MGNTFKRYIEYLRDNPQGYWFKSKVFGWGWTPATWRGWLVTFGFMLVIIGNAFRLNLYMQPDDKVPVEFIVETVFFVAAFLYVCAKKGERPRWQWGVPERRKNHK